MTTYIIIKDKANDTVILDTDHAQQILDLNITGTNADPVYMVGDPDGPEGNVTVSFSRTLPDTVRIWVETDYPCVSDELYSFTALGLFDSIDDLYSAIKSELPSPPTPSEEEEEEYNIAITCISGEGTKLYHLTDTSTEEQVVLYSGELDKVHELLIGLVHMGCKSGEALDGSDLSVHITDTTVSIEQWGVTWTLNTPPEKLIALITPHSSHSVVM